jgi:cytochrome c oxidase subunit 1
MVSDYYLHETYFVVGHFHLMIGTVTLLGLFAGVYFWFPKMFGRMMNERLGRWHFWLTAVPMLGIFLLMHLQGLGAMLRRTYDPSKYEYNAANTMLRLPITALAYAAFLGQLLFFWNFFASLRKGEKASENPWQANTLEWITPSPAPHGNFGEELPEVHRWPYDYSPPDSDEDFRPQSRPA